DYDRFDVRATARRAREAIMRHIPMILICVVCTLALALAYVKIFPPIYKAELLVAGESLDDASRNSYYAIWEVFRKSDLKSQPTLMTNSVVAKNVVQELDLKFDDVHHTFLTHVGYIWTESWIGKRYRSIKEWLFPPPASDYKATPEQIELAR